MATGTQQLTLQEFERLYAREKPYYEYLDGEAVQKQVPTILHGLLQIILGALFRRAGYRSASEVEFRISADWRPKPDVIAFLPPITYPYPTKATEIVAEILSESDRMIELYNRCERYQELGFLKIFVFDPEARHAWEWDPAKQNLERVAELSLPNGTSIAVNELWEELAQQMA